MALEEQSLSEEKGGENKITQEVKIKAENEVILSLQKQIEELSKKINEGSNQSQAKTDASVLQELVRAIKGSREDSSSFNFEANYASAGMIDEEDILPENEWVTFITNTVGYVIVDDLKNGQPVRVPYGKIEFKFESAKEIKNGKESDIFNISKYVCKSKKELEFLRKHSGYKFFHFENIKGAKGVNAQKAIKMQTIFKGLQSLGQVELVNLARQHNIAIPEDIFELRGEIAMKIVEDQILKERDQTAQLLQETKLEAEIVSSRAINSPR